VFLSRRRCHWFFLRSSFSRRSKADRSTPDFSTAFSLRTFQTIYFICFRKTCLPSLIAFCSSPLVIVLSPEANFTVCFLSSPFSIVTSTALNDFSNADLTSVLHPPHVTPDITNVYFVSACAVATKRPNSAIASFFICLIIQSFLLESTTIKDSTPHRSYLDRQCVHRHLHRRQLQHRFRDLLLQPDRSSSFHQT